MLVKIVSISFYFSHEYQLYFSRQLSACLLLSLAAGQKVWPAGVSPAACPNYPDCSLTPAGYAGAPTEFPAGVWPAACPDYPYCSLAPAAPAGNDIHLTNSLTNLLSCPQVTSTPLDTPQVCQGPPVPTTLTATSYGYTQSLHRTQAFIIVDHITRYLAVRRLLCLHHIGIVCLKYIHLYNQLDKITQGRFRGIDQ